jgi:hypothetical protein
LQSKQFRPKKQKLSTVIQIQQLIQWSSISCVSLLLAQKFSDIYIYIYIYICIYIYTHVLIYTLGVD